MSERAKSSEGLTRFVQDQLQSGTTVSTGTFSINPERAREKLRAFQLARPGSYLLKLIQAANLCGADQVRVTASRSTLEVEFDSTDEQLCSPDTVLAALVQAHSLPESPLRHLAVGLSAATSSAESMREIRWETPRGTVLLNEGAVTTKPQRSEKLRFVAHRARKLIDWFKGTVYLNEIVELTRFCGYGKTEVFLDGRAIRPTRWDSFRYPFPDYIGLGKDSHRHNLLDKISENRGELVVRLPSGSHYTLMERELLKVWNGKDAENAPPILLHTPSCETLVSTMAALAIRPVFKGPGYLGFVKHGVLLEPQALDDLGHPGIAVLVSAEQLSTDLSEFQVVQNEAYRYILAELREWIARAAEQITKSELKVALSAAGLSERQIEQRIDLVYYWLQNHQEQAPSTLEQLMNACFPRESLYRNPEIPHNKLENAREVHRDHLPADDEVLALYDDTVLGNAKLGFLISKTRICWKRTLMAPEYMVWEHLALDPPALKLDQIHFRNRHIDVTLKNEILLYLFNFLQQVPSLELPPTLRLNQDQERVLSATVAIVGSHPKLYLHPYIPAKKLETSLRSCGKLAASDDIPLVLYDGTLFGSAEEGFFATARGLYWKNFASDAIGFEWCELEPHDLKIGNSELSVKGVPLHVHPKELKESVLRLFQSLAASVAGPPT